MDEKKYLSTTEVAKILGISRVAVFKKIKSGDIRAKKIGRNYAISKSDLPEILGSVLSEKTKQEIEDIVTRVVNEYGETLRLLGNE